MTNTSMYSLKHAAKIVDSFPFAKASVVAQHDGGTTHVGHAGLEAHPSAE